MKQTLIIIGAVTVGAMLYWALSPLFIDKEVQDELDPVLEARLEAQRKADERRAEQEALVSTASEAEDTTPVREVDYDTGLVNEGPFPIQGTPGHPASGEVEVIESPEEKLVYFKNYDGTNGPDLRVYLSNDLEIKDAVDLGVAKGNKGNIIYGIPLEVNTSDYKYVLTWCEAFGVLFDYAEIN